MKKILLAVFVLSAFAFSQYTDLTQGLGFAAGMPSGLGFSYRNIGEKHGFQITTGALATNFNEEYANYYIDDMPRKIYDNHIPDESFTDQSNSADNFWGNIGLTYYRPLHRAEKSLFYGFTAASAYYMTEKYMQRTYEYYQETDTTYSYKQVGSDKELRETELDLFFGVGLGITYNITNNIRFSLELPLTISNEGQIWMIIPQGALHYFFK